MRAQVKTVLAYVGAAVTLAIAVCVPFVLMGTFSKAVAHAGLHVDASYTGGAIAATVTHGAYQTVVYQPVWPRALQQMDPFVQIAFRPVAALPRRVLEAIDLDGDGQPDVRVSFTVPPDPRSRPSGEVVALNAKYAGFGMPGSRSSFSQLMVQSNGAVVVRVPLKEAGTLR
jgi:hypothetical protein